MLGLSRHFLVSSIVTFCIAVLFALFVHEHGKPFKLLNEFQLVPEGTVLPRGCDIKIDMQTGDTWARISSVNSKSDVILSPDTENNNLSDENNAAESNLKHPEYKNVTKSRVQARLGPQVLEQIEAALMTLHLDDSLVFLEEEAAAIEFGLAVLEARNFVELQKHMKGGHVKSLRILANCLQNNPLAVEKFLQLEMVILPETTELELMAFKAVLRIVESVLKYGDELEKNKFIEKIKEDLQQLADQHEGSLEERYTDVLGNL